MPDLFDDLNKILKQDFLPILVKYFKDPNNKITDNLADIYEKFTRNKDITNNQGNYTDIENVTEIDSVVYDKFDEYAELFNRLILIEENMVQLEKTLKDKN